MLKSGFGVGSSALCCNAGIVREKIEASGKQLAMAFGVQFFLHVMENVIGIQM